MNNTPVVKGGHLTSRNTEMSIFFVPVSKTGMLKRDTLNQGIGWQWQFMDEISHFKELQHNSGEQSSTT